MVILLLSGIALAQDNNDDECDPIAKQEELTALLEEQLESEDALATMYEIGQMYQTFALDCGYIPDNIDELVVGTDIDRILIALEEVNGDPLNGQLLYNNEELAADGQILGCVGCHDDESVAPLTEGTWTRWDEIRTEVSGLEDYSFEQYMVESIVHPWDYLVPEYGEVMPNNFGDRLSYQNLADIIAYLSSQDQFLD